MSDEDAQKAAKYRKKMMILIGLGSVQMFIALFVSVFFPDRTDRLSPIFFFLAFFLLSMLSDCHLGRLVFIWKPAQPDSDVKAKDQESS
ncbi:hypothetical protein [Pseudomonas sp. PLMAX]|jgi:hypothetical protein|uniref:hypothetical protein n=1 Tax=Pseudomonas sp. PLMAX TaxID=2201998 RepID=UPI0038B974CD